MTTSQRVKNLNTQIQESRRRRERRGTLRACPGTHRTLPSCDRAGGRRRERRRLDGRGRGLVCPARMPGTPAVRLGVRREPADPQEAASPGGCSSRRRTGIQLARRTAARGDGDHTSTDRRKGGVGTWPALRQSPRVCVIPVLPGLCAVGDSKDDEAHEARSLGPVGRRILCRMQLFSISVQQGLS